MVEMTAERYPKNYHAWLYRQWIVDAVGGLQGRGQGQGQGQAGLGRGADGGGATAHWGVE